MTAATRSSRRCCGASSRRRGISPRSTGQSPSGAANLRQRDHQLRQDLRSGLPPTTCSSPTSSTPRTRCSRRLRRSGAEHPRHPARAARDPDGDTQGARRRRDALRRARAGPHGACCPRRGRSTRRSRRCSPSSSTPRGPIRDQIRPFTGEVKAVVKDVRQAAGPLASSAKDLEGDLHRARRRCSTASPTTRPERRRATCSTCPGSTTTPTAFLLTEDSGGPIVRSIALYSCQVSQLADERPDSTARPRHRRGS